MKIIFIIIVLNTINIISQWLPDIRLTNDEGISHTAQNNARSIASNLDYVHVVWNEVRYVGSGIYYRRSSDGINWTPELRITNNSTSTHPAITGTGEYIHVFWEDFRNGYFEIYYKRSTNNGSDWSPDTRLTNNPSSKYGPSVSSYDQLVVMVWDDERDSNREIYFKRSTDRGLTWQSDTRLTNNNAVSANPSIAIWESIIIVCWQDDRNNPNNQVYYKRSTDGGITWAPDIKLSNGNEFSGNPNIAASGSNFYLFWNDTRDGNFEIYYSQSSNGGLNWGNNMRLTNDSLESEFPNVCASGSAIHVAWKDNRDGNEEIYYNKSFNEGLNWGIDKRLTSNPGSSSFPSLSVSGTVVHAVWEDNRDYNLEIYYKQNPTANSIGIKQINTEITEEFKLYQNYPNPFNPVTKIKFALLPSPQGKGLGVRIIVFDILGSEVTTLVNEQLQPGTYEVEWDGSNCSSGIYYYKLITNKFTETKKMILIK